MPDIRIDYTPIVSNQKWLAHFTIDPITPANIIRGVLMEIVAPAFLFALSFSCFLWALR